MRVVEKAVGLYGPGISINRFPQGADYFIEQGRLVQDPATGLYVPDGQLIEPSFFEELRTGYDAIFLGAIGDPRVKRGIIEHAIIGTIRWDKNFDLYVEYFIN